MKYYLCVSLSILFIGLYKLSSAAERHANRDCSLRKCNITDPNCDAIGRRCKKEYRMCCDQMCHHKKEKCLSYKPQNYRNYNYSQFVSNLNASEYAKQLEEAKKKILAYAAARSCWPEHRCMNATTCKPQYQRCADGQCTILLSDCVMWWENRDFNRRINRNVTCYPDELCFRNQCKSHYWMCNTGECVHEQVVCRGGADCSDGSDEETCSGSCYPPFRCRNDQCRYGFFACGNGECILSESVCDTTKDCSDGSDELNCTGTCYPRSACDGDKCKSGYFRCDKTKCIPDSSLCDQRANCDDGSDEVREGHGFKCVLGSNFDTCLLPQALVHDSTPKCIDYADNCYVNGTNNCFTCLDQRLVISDKQQCDGVFDCYDLSDECLCQDTPAEEVCTSICTDINSVLSQQRIWPSEIFDHMPETCNCSSGKFDCGNGICLNTSQICNGIIECGSSNFDEAFCQAQSLDLTETIFCPGDVMNSSLIEAALCDGRPECHDLSDECNERCNSTPPFCNVRNMFNSEQGPYEFLCDKRSVIYFDVRSVCDGRYSNCKPRIEEEELECPARYYCQSGDAISIDKNLLCDGIPQCDDNSDEENCSDRFYCENMIPYSVPLNKMLDGKRDCSDSSDECPKEMDMDALSSRKELLGSAGFRAATWIIGLLATVGNIATFHGAIQALWKGKKINPISKINYILLINLSAADCLMGIYLLILSIKSLEFSGNYCMEDKQWRTSSTCAGIGGLALASSQASVIILVCLTTLRFYSVLNPAKITKFSSKIPICGMIFAWFTVILIATLPRASSLSDYFISDVWMPTDFTNLETRKVASEIAFVHRLSVINPTHEATPSTPRWQDIKGFLERNYPDIQIKGYFGYFSDNSVCLPKFFVSVGEAGWGYSTGIIIFNFLSFIYICVAYWLIFRVSSAGQVNKLRSKQIEKLQKRVARLVITDFICWIPICIMTFIQLGGGTIPDGAYAFSAVILLPINSAINPLLYSNTVAKLAERFYRWLLKTEKVNMIMRLKQSKTAPPQNPNRSDDEDYGTDPTLETEERTV